MAHVSLLPVKPGGGASSVPSKLMAYMLAGRPVMATVDADSDTAIAIREAGCGWVGPPENADWLTSAMASVIAMSLPELAALGRLGQAYGVQQFSRTVGVKRLADLVIRQAGRARSS